VGRQRIQSSDADPAGWTAGGAVCVAHTRIPENIARDPLRDLVPAAGGATHMRRSFGARRRGTLLFNRSR